MALKSQEELAGKFKALVQSGYKLPKKTKPNVLFTSVEEEHDAKLILDPIFRSLLGSACSPWKPTTLDLRKLHFISCPNLEKRYLERKKELNNSIQMNQGTKKKSQLPSLVEEYCFLGFKDVEPIQKLASFGLQAFSSDFNPIGATEYGINLCRFADVQFDYLLEHVYKAFKLEILHLVLVKVMYIRDKVYKVQPFADPSLIGQPRLTCHLSSDAATMEQAIDVRYANSLIYVYEYNDAEIFPVSQPRCLMPFAVVTLAGEQIDTDRVFLSFSKRLNEAERQEAPDVQSTLVQQQSTETPSNGANKSRHPLLSAQPLPTRATATPNSADQRLQKYWAAYFVTASADKAAAKPSRPAKARRQPSSTAAPQSAQPSVKPTRHPLLPDPPKMPEPLLRVAVPAALGALFGEVYVDTLVESTDTPASPPHSPPMQDAHSPVMIRCSPPRLSPARTMRPPDGRAVQDEEDPPMTDEEIMRIVKYPFQSVKRVDAIESPASPSPPAQQQQEQPPPRQPPACPSPKRIPEDEPVQTHSSCSSTAVPLIPVSSPSPLLPPKRLLAVDEVKHKIEHLVDSGEPLNGKIAALETMMACVCEEFFNEPEVQLIVAILEEKIDNLRSAKLLLDRQQQFQYQWEQQQQQRSTFHNGDQKPRFHPPAGENKENNIIPLMESHSAMRRVPCRPAEDVPVVVILSDSGDDDDDVEEIHWDGPQSQRTLTPCSHPFYEDTDYRVTRVPSLIAPPMPRHPLLPTPLCGPFFPAPPAQDVDLRGAAHHPDLIQQAPPSHWQQQQPPWNEQRPSPHRFEEHIDVNVDRWNEHPCPRAVGREGPWFRSQEAFPHVNAVRPPFVEAKRKSAVHPLLQQRPPLFREAAMIGVKKQRIEETFHPGAYQPDDGHHPHHPYHPHAHHHHRRMHRMEVNTQQSLDARWKKNGHRVHVLSSDDEPECPRTGVSDESPTPPQTEDADMEDLLQKKALLLQQLNAMADDDEEESDESDNDDGKENGDDIPSDAGAGAGGDDKGGGESGRGGRGSGHSQDSFQEFIIVDSV